MMRNLTYLGDAGLLVPASVLLAVYLLVIGRRRAAGAFAVALLSCGAVMVALKFMFRACGASLTDLDVISPSGHASSAALFYGALALLIITGRSPTVRALVAALAAALVLAIAASRVAVQAHSPAEVVFGLAVGAASVLLFQRVRGREETAMPVWPLVLGPPIALSLALVFGRHLTLEHWIAGLAQDATATFDVCRATAPAHGRLLVQRARD